MEPEADTPPDAITEKPAAPAPKPPSVLAEKLGEKLREEARRRRPRRLTAWLLALLVLAGLAALGAWWFWPRPEPPDLAVTAFDQLAVAGAPLTVRARLEPVVAEAAAGAVGGRELTFEAVPAAAGGSGKAATDERGLASLAWGEAKEGRSAFVARYVLPDRRAESPGNGRVFVLPEKTDVVVVDVASLTEAGDKLGATDGPAEARLLPGAAEALRDLARKKYAVVYIATRPERAVSYGRLRDWVERQAGVLPDGPVLGRESVRPVGGELLRGVAQLIDEFEGKKVVIAADNTTLASFRWHGIWVRRINPKEGSWKDLGNWLAK
jgi:hypothetical protein